MTLSEKLKKLLIRDIEEINSKCQIYYNQNTKSIWFINPETKFWYFEYSLDGDLWWRYTGFNIFKDLYRMDDKTFDDIISEWVEEVLNCKVVGTAPYDIVEVRLVEEVLNCKVLTTTLNKAHRYHSVEETLKCKVITIEPYEPFYEVNTDKIINESQTI